MIDCENEVYTKIARILRTEFQDINVSGEYIKSPSTFPYVSITMSDNIAISNKLDTSMTENISQVMFEINVYSNKTSGKKTECKSIMKLIDETLFSMNFRRLMLSPMPNMEDATIYRITARYIAVTDGKYFYRR